MPTINLALNPTTPPANGWIVKYRQLGTSGAYTAVPGSPFTSSPAVFTLPDGVAYDGIVIADCGDGRFTDSPYKWSMPVPDCPPGESCAYDLQVTQDTETGDFTVSVPGITAADANVNYFVGTTIGGYNTYAFYSINSTTGVANVPQPDPGTPRRYTLFRLCDTEVVSGNTPDPVCSGVGSLSIFGQGASLYFQWSGLAPSPQNTATSLLLGYFNMDENSGIACGDPSAPYTEIETLTPSDPNWSNGSIDISDITLIPGQTYCFAAIVACPEGDPIIKTIEYTVPYPCLNDNTVFFGNATQTEIPVTITTSQYDTEYYLNWVSRSNPSDTGNSGWFPNTATFPGNVNYTATGLQPDTVYDFYLKKRCTGGAEYTYESGFGKNTLP